MRNKILALFGFVLCVLLIPGITGAGTTPRWALAAICLPLLIRNEVKFIPALTCLLLFTWYAAITVSWSHPYDGLNGLFQLLVFAEAVILGSQLDDIRPLVIGCGLGIWASSAVMFLGIDVPHATPNAGLFTNANVMGEIAALILVAAVVERLWWLVPGILPALVLSGCRGAFVAVGVAAIAWLWSRSRVASVALGVAGGALLCLAWQSPSAQHRLEFWQSILPHLSLFGTGLGSVYTMYPLYDPSEFLNNVRPDHLHNDWLEYLFETGAASLLILAFLWGVRSIIVLALFVEGCFGFPLHLPATLVFGGIAAGHAIRRRSDLLHMRSQWGDIFRKGTVGGRFIAAS